MGTLNIAFGEPEREVSNLVFNDDVVCLFIFSIVSVVNVCLLSA